MISNTAYPLVRAMLAGVYNNSFLATHPNHTDLTAEHVTLEWVGTTTYFPCVEADLTAAELVLGAQPHMVAEFANESDDSLLPPPLVLAANAYMEHLGMV